MFSESAPLRNRIAWLLAAGLLFGLIQSLPSLLIPMHRDFFARRFPEARASWANDGPFTHYACIGGEGEDILTYMSRGVLGAKELIPGDPFIPGGDRTPKLLMRDVLGFVILGTIHRLTGNPEATLVAARVLMTAILFLGLFWLSEHAGLGPRRAFFNAAFFTIFLDITVASVDLADPLVGIKTFARKFFWLLGGDYHFFGLNRIMRPAFNYPALLLAFLACVRALRPPTSLWAAAGAGLAGGALAYIHPDVWLLWVTAAAAFWARRLVLEKKLDPSATVICAVGAAISLPFFFINVATDTDSLTNIPVVMFPVFYPPSLLYLAAALWFWLKKEKNSLFEWAGAAMLAAALHSSLSLFIGIGFDPTYISGAANLILFPLATAAALSFFPESERWLWLALLTMWTGIARTVSYSGQVYQSYGLQSETAAAFSWIKKNLPPDSSFAVLDGEIAIMLPMHAGARSLTHRPNPIVTMMGGNEVVSRVRYMLELYAPPKNLDAAIKLFSEPGDLPFRENQAWTGKIDRAPYHAVPGVTLYPPGIKPISLIGRLKEPAPYPVLLEAKLRAAAGKKYRVDYLWEGPLERGLRPSNLGAPPGAGTLLYESPSVRIYTAKKTQADQ